ncbi:MAG TPA: ABC transporter ATP-binding protein [Rubricoccaceae bacterium]|nr:ABC transporter ATP-binding protein [Rubricoccaceae bacterium]
MEAPPRSTDAGVRLDAVTKRYGAVAAVDGVLLEVPPGAFVSLLGPSGCGKTTLLRLVGGFETPDAGRVWIGAADVTRRPPQARRTAMVFQHYALFPTMTVGENVGYGLTVRKEKKTVVREKVERALARVDLAGLEARPVSALSGGQQQRVALARALAVEPAVLLFDEPLSNLDPALRESTRAELKGLQRELGTTSLYVTHDQAEALALSDRIAVMHAGKIVEEGPPEQLYDEPATAYVARFLGGANVIENGPLAAVLTGEALAPGEALAVRPDALEPVDAEAPGAVPARCLARLFLGTHAEWTVEAGGQRLRLWADPQRPVPEQLFVRTTRHRRVRA